MQPVLSRVDGMGGTARRTTVHRAATMETTSMMGASISSALLAPTRGTNQSVRIVPSTKPAANTNAKYSARLKHLHDSGLLFWLCEMRNFVFAVKRRTSP
jgi:hypothetical protein